MHRLSVASALLAVALSATPGFADDLSDAELLALFQSQRDAFVAARIGGQGQTRGLTLVTADSVEPAIIAVEPAPPEMTTTIEDAPAIIAHGSLDTATIAPDTITVAPEMTVMVQDAPAIILPTTETGAALVSLSELPPEPVADLAAMVDLAPASSGPAALTPVIFGDFAPELQVNLNIEFAFDSASLQTDHTPIMNQMCAVMKLSDINLFRIVGHTDAAGTAEYNQTLSQLRAEEVRRYLVNDCGIDSKRLEAVGLGEQFLSNRQDPKAAANRRVEFQALS